MKSRDQIIKKLFSKKHPSEFGISEDQFSKIKSIVEAPEEISEDIEIPIGTSEMLSVAIIESGDEQYLIRIYLLKPEQPKLTILYDQSQFSNLDRTVFKLCKAGIYLYP